MTTTLLPGASIGRFRLEAEIGRGGMGVVYRALDPVLNRPVALKVLAPHLGDDESVLARFHREAAANLKHPHIATIYEFGEHEGQPYIAFEWIEGRALKTIIDAEGRLPLDRALRLFDQLADALHALQLEIADDGIGLPANRVAGVGLTSMRERAEELGGTCAIESRPEGGTCVVARLPINF